MDTTDTIIYKPLPSLNKRSSSGYSSMMDESLSIGGMLLVLHELV